MLLFKMKSREKVLLYTEVCNFNLEQSRQSCQHTITTYMPNLDYNWLVAYSEDYFVIPTDTVGYLSLFLAIPNLIRKHVILN